MPASAVAQVTQASPNTVTPPTLAPAPLPDTASITLPETASLAPPTGSGALRVVTGRVNVEGAFPAVAAEAASLARSLEGKSVTLAEVYRVASSIEAAHARAGFVLARVAVPPQRLVDGGPIRIVVIDGFVEAVDAAALPARVRRPIAARLAGLVGRRRVRLDTIERQLLLAGQVAGVSLRSTLARGGATGGVRLIVDGRWRPVGATLRADNALDRSLGSASETVQVSLNGLLGLGETLYGYAATSDLPPFGGDDRVRVFGGGALFAIGDGRLTLNPEATVSRTLPAPPSGAPRTSGKLTRVALRSGYVLTQTRTRRAALDLSVELLDQRATAIDFATDIAHDRYGVARFGASYGRSGGRLDWIAAAQLGQGLGSLLIDPVAPPSRQGATATFTKLTAQGRATIALGPRLFLSGVALAQSSFGRPLLRAEQFQLEGADAVSAYVGGVTTVDQGVTGRGEASVRMSRGTLVLTPYLFGAAGYGSIARPTAVEAASLTAGALGGGARLFLSGGKVTVGVEYAYGRASISVLDKRGRFNVAAGVRF